MPEETHEEPRLWQRFKELWFTLFGIQAIMLILGFTITGPLLSFVLSRALSTSGKAALSDTDIAGFFLRPSGLILGAAIAGLAITLNVFAYAAQLIAAHSRAHGLTPSIHGSLIRASMRLPVLIRLSLRFLVHLAILALPFLAIIGAVAFFQLRQNDINYYLDARPPEFLLACGFTVLLLIAMTSVLIHQTVGWFHAMPLVLFRKESPADARRHSLEKARGSRRRITLALALWGFGTPLLISLLNYPWGPLTMKLTEVLQHRLGLLALALAVILIVSTGIALLIGFTTISLLAIDNIRLFRRAGLDSHDPPKPLRSTSFRTPWKTLGAASIVALLITIAFCHRWLDDLPTDDHALIIAHRGASAAAPENTIAAIEAAIDAGSDWIEIDVQETDKDEVIVFHDSDYMRVSRNPLTSRGVGPDDIANVDIGSWFDPKFADQRTPTLREVLELCRDKAGVLIELKYYGHERQLEQRTIDIVEDLGMVDQVKVMSLSYDGIQTFRKLRPEWPVGLLSTVAMGDLTQLDLDFLGLNARSASSRLVSRAHAAGIDVYTWTVNDAPSMSALLSRGIDGIITDEPGIAHKLLDERKDLNPGERLLIGLAARVGRPIPESQQ